mgnify:CR=1 FL=1
MIADNKVKNKSFVGVFLMDGTDDGVKLALTKKPNLIRRILIRILLGWVWFDVK